MSLLEDVFLEDEAGEAQELERIIEGDEFEERPRSRSPDSDTASEKEDEAEEDKRRVDPTKAKTTRVVKNPRFVLNPARLTGPRGIHVLPEHFKDFKFKGKGHEKEDLDLVLKKLEHWAYRLYPKFKFEDCLKKIETLGKKRPVKVNLHKIRTDQFTSEETVVQKDSSEDEAPEPVVDEFDILLQQQIDLARATPAPSSAKKGFETPSTDRSMMMPKATSSPSINDEQRERMLRNRRLAEERRMARHKQNSNDNNENTSENNIIVHNNSVIHDNFDNNDHIILKKHNKSNIIDSSDEENDNSVVNQSITVDIHDNSRELSKHNHNDNGVIDKQINMDKEMNSIEEVHNHNDNNETEKQIPRDNQMDIIKEAHNHNNESDEILIEDNQADNHKEANNHNDNDETEEQIAGDNRTDVINAANIQNDNNESDEMAEENINESDDNKVDNGKVDNGKVDNNVTDKQMAINKEKPIPYNDKVNENLDIHFEIRENVDNEESKQQNLEKSEIKEISDKEFNIINDNKTNNTEENSGVNEEVMDVDFNDEF